jgi:DNA-binding MarR family transcriptional regulator
MNTRGSTTRPKEGTFRLIVLDILFLSGAFEKRGKKMASKVGLTEPQWGLLATAASQERTVPQIARRLGLARQTVQRNSDLMVKRGLGAYAKNPDHLRSPLFLLTVDGKAVLERLEQIAQQDRVDFMATHQIANDELQVAQKVLREMREFVDPRKSPVDS